jgi:hypothetical protein
MKFSHNRNRLCCLLFIIDDVIWKMLLKIVNEDIGDHKYIVINIINCPLHE